MPGHDIICIGASAGGVPALVQLVSALPPDLPASIFIALHVSPYGPSYMPGILSRAGPLPATNPHDGQPIEKGQIYIAPPDRHLFIVDSRVQVVRGPRENGYRPAIDALFRTAALNYGPRVVGVVLTGTLDDGTIGLGHIHRRGGLTMVQEPTEALYPDMPLSAIEHVPVDYVLPIAQIAPALVRLSMEEVKPVREEQASPTPDASDVNGTEIVQQDKLEFEEGKTPNTRSVLTCPDCGGVLWELDDGQLVHFRCHVGHTYSLESLVAEQDETVEHALWSAVRILKERAMLMDRLATRLGQQGTSRAAGHFNDQAREAERNADLIRQLILRAGPPPGEPGAPEAESGTTGETQT